MSAVDSLILLPSDGVGVQLGQPAGDGPRRGTGGRPGLAFDWLVAGPAAPAALIPVVNASIIRAPERSNSRAVTLRAG